MREKSEYVQIRIEPDVRKRWQDYAWQARTSQTECVRESGEDAMKKGRTFKRKRNGGDGNS